MAEPIFELDEYDEVGNIVATYVYSDEKPSANQNPARIDAIVRWLNHHPSLSIHH